ncbi:MAG TPA: SUMF1/EgtB/PvdO family nonheme iron enzyme [Anaerolineales bacterium]|nr:SUMF1/EgtB/PvdO family nonheme iron enzyme [Anaerolineales bacterium]
MAKSSIYTVGGTVQAGGGLYIKRKADDELLQLCRQAEIALVLSSRQVGKSSLMVRTAEQLEADHIRSVIIDLSAIGTQVTQDEWYLGILNEINDTLKFKTDIFNWWKDHDQLGPTQRLTNFFRDVLLKEVDESVVLFFDEIDSTLSVPFSDDFFAALRAVYNARSTTPEFRRLSFVLIGVATPSDLITDSKRTPFNLGRRVELMDFTLEEARPLAAGLGENPEQVLGKVFGWTGGHPYLTQRLCSNLAKRGGDLAEQVVDATVEQLFIGEQGWQDNNIQFVKEMLAERTPDVRKVLKVYKEIRAGKKVMDDERSIPKAHLKISGVVRRQDEHLVPRNQIYERIFDLKWIRENMPPSTTRNVVIGAALIVVVALMIAGFFAYQEYTRSDEERTARFESNFNATNDPRVRLENLARIFELQDKSFGVRARNLFNGLPQAEKLALFTPTNSASMREDQVSVILGIYQSLDNTPEGNIILKAMGESMKVAKPDLANEINFWVGGREALNAKNYYDAKSELTRAIDWNTKNPAQNPALYYDRAQVYINMGKETYPDALNDLTQMIKLDPNRKAAARLLINKDVDFSQYWKQNSGSYPDLAEAIPLVVGIVDDKGAEMVLVPAGNFSMGSDTGDVDEKPIHVVYLDDFHIDKYEVTNKLYKACVDAGVCQPPVDTSTFTRASYYGNAQFENYPVIWVDWNMANTYCEWRGARLPTEAEWEKAAHGTDGRTYPWGEVSDCTSANFGSCVGDTTPVGSYESGQSPYGVYDMAGNVWEWVNDWYSGTYYQSSPGENPPGPDSGAARVLRGGSWDAYAYLVRSADRVWLAPADSHFNVGFRCSRSP